jgi:hypothetical protein
MFVSFSALDSLAFDVCYPFIDQSPPKRDLLVSDPNVRDLSLVELQLSPSSILLLRFTDESLNGGPVPLEVMH